MALAPFPVPPVSPLLSDTVLGVLILSLGKDIVYINAPAHRFVEDLRQHDHDRDVCSPPRLPIPLVSLCDDLITQLGPPSQLAHWPTIQVQRRLMGKTGPILTRGLGLPDFTHPEQGKLILMLEQAASSAVATRPATPSPGLLTSREQSVVQGMAAGLTNKQIGERLNLTEGTVKEYVKRIRLKVGPMSRGTVRSRVKNLPIDAAVNALSGGTTPSGRSRYVSA